MFLFCIYKYFAVSDTHEKTCQFQELVNLELTNDAEMDAFMRKRIHTVINMRDRPEEGNLRDLPLKQFRKA